MRNYLNILYKIQELFQSHSYQEYDESLEEGLLLLSELIAEIELDQLKSDLDNDDEEIPTADE